VLLNYVVFTYYSNLNYLYVYNFFKRGKNRLTTCNHLQLKFTVKKKYNLNFITNKLYHYLIIVTNNCDRYLFYYYLLLLFVCICGTRPSWL